MRREVMALVVLVLMLGVSALVYFGTDAFRAVPVQRSEQQNSGVNAPSEQVLSPGTVPDEQGDAALPEQQQ